MKIIILMRCVTSLPKCQKRDYLSDQLPLTRRPKTGILKFFLPGQMWKFNWRRIVCVHLRLKGENNLKLSLKPAGSKCVNLHASLWPLPRLESRGCVQVSVTPRVRYPDWTLDQKGSDFKTVGAQWTEFVGVSPPLKKRNKEEREEGSTQRNWWFLYDDVNLENNL